MFKLDINYLDLLVKSAQIDKKIEDPLKEVTELGLQSSCTIYVFSNKNKWSGSGFHIGNGLIITAAHVVPNDFDISEDNKNLNLLYMLFSLIYFGQKIIYVSKENIIKNDLKEIINVMHKLNLIKYIK